MDALTPGFPASLSEGDEKRRLSSLRKRLVLLIVGIAVPLLALGIGAVWQAHLSERGRIEARLVETARAISASVDSEMRQSEGYLRALAASPSLATGDWLALYRQAQASAEAGTFVAIFDSSGRRLLNTYFPIGGGSQSLDAPTRTLVETALSRNAFTVTGVIVNSPTGEPAIMAGLPAVTRSGDQVVVAQIIPSRVLRAALTQQAMQEDWIAAILDAEDRVVSRTRDEGRFVGSVAIPAVRQALAGGTAGIVKTRTVENLPATLAFARAPASRFSTVIAIPETVFNRAFAATIAPVALIGLSLIAATLGIAMLASSRILSTVRRDYAAVEARRILAAERLRVAGEALQETERKFQTIANAMPQLVWSAGPDGFVDYFNERWHEYTGRDPNASSGWSWQEVLHPDDVAPTIERWQNSLSTGEPYEVEYRLKSAAGGYRWFMGRGEPIRDDEGRIERWFGTCTDIDDKKHDEQALVTAQEQLEQRVRELESVYDHAPVGLALIDADFTFLRVNQALAAMDGRPLADHRGMPVFSVIPHFEARLRPVMERVLAGETQRNIEIQGEIAHLIYPSRTWRAHLYPVRNAAGEVRAIGAFCEDVTAARLADVALAEEKARLERLMLSAPNMIYITDVQRRQNAYVNPQVLDSLGYAPAELQGRDMAELNSLIHPDDRKALARFGRAVRRLADGEVREAEYRLRHSDGSYRWFLIRETPFQRNAAGRITQILGTGLDISGRKQAEENQQVLIRELHHRVKNILATVQAIASTTGRSATTFAAFREDFAERLVSLGRTHSLLTREAWSGAPLHDILRGELEPYTGTGSERVVIDGPDITIPRDMTVTIGMAIHELTTNAVKYGALSVPAGRVHVRIEADRTSPEPHLSVTWTEAGGPPVAPPSRQGFGTLLLQRLFASQLGGEVAIDYRPGGIVARLEVVLRADEQR
ncbi:PAS domain S-box protein [Phreatobacter sp.]|uniref:PAS domain S-box protein n=1 Tax=Phreatobacter sp. TaxID=1966341 RepID=UPI003F7304D7